ncbi:MAG TPA: putative glycoside hydrolase [Longimicrobiaceae bacterium]|nr:putative glycoside hydrolase [Longimicrobiaceae bacterium]
MPYMLNARASLLLAVTTVFSGCGDGGDRANAAPATDSTQTAVAAEPAPAPPTPRESAPDIIRGLYINAYQAGSDRRLHQLMAIADTTEINTFVVDVKDERGIRYNTEIPLAQELADEKEIMLGELSELADTLQAHDIYSIARIVLFKDPILSKARPDWSVKQPNGELWVDKAGNTWVSPWDKDVWDYNLDIAEEVARAGFDEIQFDYVRFAEPYASLPPQIHPEAEGDKTDAIAAFLNEAKRRLHPLGVVVAADVFGLSPNTPDDVNIGQQWETIASTADHILPMMYPSHYLPTHLPGVPNPNRMPYETIYKSAGMAVLRNDAMREVGVQPARVIPWLQAFSASWLGDFEYGPEQLKDQIRGVYAVGLEDWILWHPGSQYEPYLSVFEDTLQSHAMEYTPPADVLAVLERFENQGIHAARRKAAEQAAGRTTDAAAAEEAKGNKF